MSTSQFFNEIPWHRLRPAAGYGLKAGWAFSIACLFLLCLQWGFHAMALDLPQFPFAILAALSYVASWHFLRRRFFSMHLRGGRQPPRNKRHLSFPPSASTLHKVGEYHEVGPDPSAQLEAWTCSGDVIELVFDRESWLLVRQDVNDTEWRNVHRLLVWCKRVPSRIQV